MNINESVSPNINEVILYINMIIVNINSKKNDKITISFPSEETRTAGVKEVHLIPQLDHVLGIFIFVSVIYVQYE